MGNKNVTPALWKKGAIKIRSYLRCEPDPCSSIAVI